MTKLKIIFTNGLYAIIEYDEETKKLVIGSQIKMEGQTIAKVERGDEIFNSNNSFSNYGV